LDDEILDAATTAVLATETEVAEFKDRLDIYDEATVKALMENDQQLALVRAQIEALLSQAYVMEDGRRVFKTEDGMQVFDEFGTRVFANELDFDEIDASRPTWEVFSAEISLRNNLETQREQILEFQEIVDTTREKISEAGITAPELKELDAELAEALPPSVKAQMPGIESLENTTTQQAAFNAASGVSMKSGKTLDVAVSAAPKIAPA